MSDITIVLSEKEAKLLRGCLIRTFAKGEMLDVGEKVDDIITNQLNENKDE
jgi:hypothetical protein